MPKPLLCHRLHLFLLGLGVVGLMSLWQVDERVARLWLNTAALAAGAAVIGMSLGTFAAIAITKTDAPGGRLAALIFTAMLFVPLYLVTGAWDAGFGIQGWHTLTTNPHLAHEPWLAGWRAAIWVHGVAAVPWVALIVGAGLRSVEAELEEEAATFTSPSRVLWHVTLPRAAGSLILAFMWIAIVVTAEISVTDFFQVRTFAEETYTQAALGTLDFAAPKRVGDGGKEIESVPSRPIGPAGLWLGLLLSAALSLAAIAVARRFFAQFADSPHRPPWMWRLGGNRWIAGAGLWFIVLLLAGVPLANLIYKAGGEVTVTETSRVRSWSAAKALERVTAAPEEFRGDLWLSVWVGAAATTAAVAVGLPLAWSMRLSRRTPWLRLTALALCLTIPGPLLGIALIRVLNRPPDSPLAALAVLYDSNFAPWLVQTIRALPMVTLILWAALASVPLVMLDAATVDGSGWWGRLLRIAVPQRWSAVAAAWLVGLAITVGELAATVLVVPPQLSTPISVRVFQLLHYGVDDRVAAICLVMMAAIAVMTGIAAMLWKRMFVYRAREQMTNDQ